MLFAQCINLANNSAFSYRGKLKEVCICIAWPEFVVALLQVAEENTPGPKRSFLLISLRYFSIFTLGDLLAAVLSREAEGGDQNQI